MKYESQDSKNPEREQIKEIRGLKFMGGAEDQTNKQTDRRRQRTDDPPPLPWILVCLQLLNLTLEETIISASFQ